MHKAQRSGMQSLSGTKLKAVLNIGLVGRRTFATQYFGASITFVAEHGVADMLHVGPYLMGSACLEDAFHEGDIPKTFKHPIMGDGGFAHFAVWRKHCHAKPITWIAPDVTLYASLVFCEIGPHQGVIAAVSGFVEELSIR